MSKTAVLALLAATTLAAGPGLASERSAALPTAPSFVRELGAARTATVGGTVVALGRDGHFVLADAEDARITVDAGHLGLENLAPGQMITVTGRLDEGELRAGHAVREDGSEVVRTDRDEADETD